MVSGLKKLNNNKKVFVKNIKIAFCDKMMIF